MLFESVVKSKVGNEGVTSFLFARNVRTRRGSVASFDSHLQKMTSASGLSDSSKLATVAAAIHSGMAMVMVMVDSDEANADKVMVRMSTSDDSDNGDADTDQDSGDGGGGAAAADAEAEADAGEDGDDGGQDELANDGSDDGCDDDDGDGVIFSVSGLPHLLSHKYLLLLLTSGNWCHAGNILVQAAHLPE